MEFAFSICRRHPSEEKYVQRIERDTWNEAVVLSMQSYQLTLTQASHKSSPKTSGL